MGDHEDLPKSNGLLMPNGLRPSEAAATVTRTLDAERWSLVEERTSELIARIQPNKPSEERRIAVANYVQQLIKKCFPCQVFTFGSVPLKTYLPDGDIDLTTFSKNLDLKDTWANEVREILEHEEKSEDAEFCVKEVQYIKAEVKIIKCLVENIVVDISFNQLGGLCTLCFLEEIDHLINQDHLFKRSIILIKAWCYYESRILGAHHGLLSTYALETLVLYIFHVFNNSFAGPLEVLYRFLEFFSKFDWENFCVSLWGPVPISSLPDTTAEPPRKDGGDLLLSRIFLDACSAVYAVFPSGHDTQGQPFVSKHFNVIDPLRINNNLGRSVSKGNFYRIRSAFAFGAKRLAGLLECPKEDIIAEVDKFFANTRQRHGSGNRPDAPASIPLQPQPPNSDPNQALESCKNQGNTRKKTETARLRPGHQFLTVASASLSDSLSQQVISGSQNPPNVNRTTSPSGSQSQKAYSCQTSYRVLDQIAKNISSNETVHKERFKSHSKPCQFSNDYVGHGKLQFARTHSSPELSDTSAQILSRSRRSVPDNGKNHFISSKPNINSRKTFGPDVLGCQNARLVNDSLSPKYTSSHQNCIPTPDSNCIPNNFHDNTGFATTGEELASASQALEMHQEEQDMVNMMSSPRVNGLVQQLQLPISFTTHQFPVPSPILRPVGYSQKNIGVIPANVPVAPWPPQFSQGFVPPSLSSYFSNAQLETSSEEALESGNDASSMTELNQEDADHGCWPEQETASSVGFIPPDRNFQIFNSNDKKGPCGGFDFIPLSQISNPNVPFMRDHAKIARENINMDRSSHDDPTMHQNMTETDVYTSNRSTDTKLHASWGSSSRSMVADSWDGPSIKAPKLPRDRWGRKPASSAASSTSYGNTKSWRQYEDSSLDHASISRDDDIGEWIKESSSSNEVAEPSDSMSQICGSQPPPGPEPTLMSGSDSGLPVAPMFLCTGPRQRSGNSSGSVFYPTGPPVPFYMLPVYKIPSDSGASDGTLEQLNGLDANWSNPLVRDVDSNEKSEQAEVPVSTSVIDDASSEPFVERKSDILNGDFSSHWQNLQYGRLCQDPSVPGPPIYPAPIVVPPMYFQGHYPLDGPGRAFSANANLLPVMSYSPRILQVMPLQAGSVRHSELFQRYGDEAPSFRGGTGTFLPKAKIPLRARPPGTRNHRASYNYDRSDHGDREGSWKSRVPNRGHGNGQHDKPNTRPDRLPAVDNRTDRSWDSHKNERAILNHQNNSLSSTWPSHGPANMTYGMYPIASMNSHNAHPSGTPIPSFVMLYSYNHPNLGYGSSSEPVEFGSLGPMHLSSINEVQPPNNGGVPRNAFEPRHETCQQGSECSSPDQPSSPHIRRSAVERNYQLKEEDFPPL